MLVDFGIAKVYQTGQYTMTGAKALTPGFAAPEQYLGGTDWWSDIYSLGATLYAVLTGSVPPDAKARQGRSATLVPPRALKPIISVQTENVILRSMDLLPRQRFESADMMRRALQSETIVSDATGTPFPRWRGNKAWVLILASVVGVLGLLGVGGLLWVAANTLSVQAPTKAALNTRVPTITKIPTKTQPPTTIQLVVPTSTLQMPTFTVVPPKLTEIPPTLGLTPRIVTQRPITFTPLPPTFTPTISGSISDSTKVDYELLQQSCEHSDGTYLKIFVYSVYPDQPLSNIHVRGSYTPDGPAFDNKDEITNSYGEANFVLSTCCYGARIGTYYVWLTDEKGLRISEVSKPIEINGKNEDFPDSCWFAKILFKAKLN